LRCFRHSRVLPHFGNDRGFASLDARGGL
jgi:hypothetical protein